MTAPSHIFNHRTRRSALRAAGVKWVVRGVFAMGVIGLSSVADPAQSAPPPMSAGLMDAALLPGLDFAAVLKPANIPSAAFEESHASVAASNVLLPHAASSSGLHMILGAVAIVFGVLLATITATWRVVLYQAGRFNRPTWETWG